MQANPLVRLGEELDGSPPKHWIRQKEIIIDSRRASGLSLSRYTWINCSAPTLLPFLAPHFYVCLTAPVAFFVSLAFMDASVQSSGDHLLGTITAMVQIALLTFFSCPFNAPSLIAGTCRY